LSLPRDDVLQFNEAEKEKWEVGLENCQQSDFKYGVRLVFYFGVTGI
jgi:hypothetical protein